MTRVEILSSLPLHRGNDISVGTRRLSQTIDKAFHAHAFGGVQICECLTSYGTIVGMDMIVICLL